MRALFRGALTLCVTPEVLAEYQTALYSRSVVAFARQRGLSVNYVQDYIQAVVDVAEVVSPGPRFRCRDADDEKYTEASSGARAEYLVSSDPALLEHVTVLEARVTTPEDFARALGL